MDVRTGRSPLRTPERLDGRFGLVAGLYVAALLSPALLLVPIQWLEPASRPVALGSLVIVGAVITASVALGVTRQGGLVRWFDSTWVAVLVPSVGVVPMIAYFHHFILVVAFAVTDLRADGAASLVGFVGFFLGFVATSLGAYLVLMAHTRLANATVDESAVTAEWTARWPHRARLRFVAGTLAVVGLVAGAVVRQLGWSVLPSVLLFGVVLAIVVRTLFSEHTYRATTAGLEVRRDGRWVLQRRLVPWSRVEGFSVTDDAIVLHRALPHVDVRCRRYDLHGDDEAVIAALDDYLDRRDS